MSRHISAERLSAYLDEELEAREIAALERHLRDCESCRAHLAGLRRVIAGLRSFERVAPPPVLQQAVVRRLALDRPRGLISRLETQLESRPRLEPGMIIPFALVFTLAMIAYFFAQAVERHQQSSVVVPVGVESLADEVGKAPQREVNGQVFVRQGTGWRQEGLRVEPTRELETGTPEAMKLVLEHPWLERLLADGDRVVAQVDGEVVALNREKRD